MDYRCSRCTETGTEVIFVGRSFGYICGPWTGTENIGANAIWTGTDSDLDRRIDNIVRKKKTSFSPEMVMHRNRP
jgi:hypothetical protein